jgi:hypothetical protein
VAHGGSISHARELADRSFKGQAGLVQQPLSYRMRRRARQVPVSGVSVRDLLPSSVSVVWLLSEGFAVGAVCGCFGAIAAAFHATPAASLPA